VVVHPEPTISEKRYGFIARPKVFAVLCDEKVKAVEDELIDVVDDT
jgi:hypothetical protein